MKNRNAPILTSSSDSLRTLYRHRNRANPTEGNRTIVAVTICVLLMILLIISAFLVEAYEIQHPRTHALQLGYFTQHVLAMFVILLFLLIDGSPETLALGLFLGCDSLARSFDILPTKIPLQVGLQHSLFFAADLFRLYFATQLARVAPKHLAPWLKWGAILAIPYGIAMQLSPGFREEYSPFIHMLRYACIGVISSWLCFRVAFAISADKVPWRVFALLIAGLGFLETPASLAIEVSSSGPASLQTIVVLKLIHTASIYLLSLAAFINISTLENRIRALSTAKSELHLEKVREEQRIHTAIAKTTQMLAHDVRKPFSLIKAYSDSLIIASTPEEARKILAKMIPDVQKSLKTVDQLISDVMDIGRDMPTNIQALEIHRLIAQAIDQAFRVSPKSDITFKYHFRHQGLILGDEQQLVRAFTNILENAEQAINGKSEQITFSTFNDSGNSTLRISIEIHNSGTTVEKADLKNLFDAFFTKGKKSGTGLGLAIVKKIILAHKGEVSAASDPGSGTSFRFLLPAQFTPSRLGQNLPRHSKDVHLSIAMASPDQIQSEPMPLSASRKNPTKVLIVDDESAYASSIRSLIEPLLETNSQIHAVTDPDQAIFYLQHLKPDLLICDFDLKSSQIDGVDILKGARAYVPNCFNLLHTNHVLDINEMKKIGSAMDLFLPKPAKISDLQGALDAIKKRGVKNKIIIIEDDVIFAESLERKLSEYSVIIYAEPSVFFSTLEKNSRFLDDVIGIITDLHFDNSDLTGINVAQNLSNYRTPVYLYSNSTESGMDLFDGILKKDLSDITEFKDRLNSAG